MKIRPRTFLHVGVELVVMATVTTVANRIINSNVEVDDTNLDRIRVRVGTVLLGMLVSDMVSGHINRSIDLGLDTAQAYLELKKFQSIEGPDDLEATA
jgi:hypothetical protein